MMELAQTIKINVVPAKAGTWTCVIMLLAKVMENDFSVSFLLYARSIPDPDSCLRRNGLPRIICGDGKGVSVH
jgi:hypothetical protein